MSMMRKLFRPGKGSTVARYTAAFCNGATTYRSDVAMWDTTAPTDQGSSGVLEGKTLGTSDYVFVKISSATAITNFGLLAGVFEGTHIGQTSSTVSFLDDSLVIVQTHGPGRVYCDATVAAPAVLFAQTTAGAVADVAASDLDATNSTYSSLGVVGVALDAAVTDYTRLASTVQGVTAFIRCDY